MYRIYTVYSQPTGAPEDVVFVREGCAWWAVLFGPFWFLYHRLWLLTGAYVVLLIVMGFTFTALALNQVVQSVIDLVITLAIAASANDLRRWHLERKEYVEVDLVGAPDLTTAEEVYFSRYAARNKSAETNTLEPGIPAVDSPHSPSPRRRVLSPFASESLGPS